MKAPNVESMLPSAAKRALVDFFLQKIINTGVNSRNEPMYRYAQALGDVRSADTYVSGIVYECYELALKDFECQHPLRWDNELQRAYREGLEPR